MEPNYENEYRATVGRLRKVLIETAWFIYHRQGAQEVSDWCVNLCAEGQMTLMEADDLKRMIASK